jgi:hypothetical protein
MVAQAFQPVLVYMNDWFPSSAWELPWGEAPALPAWSV